MTRPKRLTCCCCGDEAIGRQWWNRDAGYGLCVGCIATCDADIPVGETHPSYGVRGFHYDITPEPSAEVKRFIGAYI